MLDVREYIDASGRSPFGKWLFRINIEAAAKVATALERIADGNFSNVKPVGGGVLEYKIDFGPGYRIYFGRDGELLVILLAGGTKKRQHIDILDAKVNWQDYLKRKSKESKQWHSRKTFAKQSASARSRNQDSGRRCCARRLN